MAASTPSTAFDPHTPKPARIFDYWLDRHNNYEADRRKADEVEAWYPSVRQLVAENEAFVGRAVTWAARNQIRGYVDLGSGLPAGSSSVHTAARAVFPDARVAYVDHDLEVTGQAEMILDRGFHPGIAVICADLRDPAAVLATIRLQDAIDLGRPACVLLALVLHFMPAGMAREVVAGYAAQLAPGSLVVISTTRNDDPGSFREVRALWPGGEVYNHTREDVAGFFGDLELVPPGLVVARAWRGGMRDTISPAAPLYVFGGVGRKMPGPRRRLSRRGTCGHGCAGRAAPRFAMTPRGPAVGGVFPPTMMRSHAGRVLAAVSRGPGTGTGGGGGAAARPRLNPRSSARRSHMSSVASCTASRASSARVSLKLAARIRMSMFPMPDASSFLIILSS
jgi:hypothetical protein